MTPKKRFTKNMFTKNVFEVKFRTLSCARGIRFFRCVVFGVKYRTMVSYMVAVELSVKAFKDGRRADEVSFLASKKTLSAFRAIVELKTEIKNKDALQGTLYSILQ